MKSLRLLSLILIVFCFSVFLNQNNYINAATQYKTYTSSNPKFKFSLSYPTTGWLRIHDIKIQRRSRFKDIFVIMRSNRVNQIRVTTLKGIHSPDARMVARLLEGEYVRDEIRHGEEYRKIIDKAMKPSLVRSSGAKEGWLLGFTYWDRREGTLYNLYYIYYRKFTLPPARRGGRPLITGRAYVIRAVIKKVDYPRLAKQLKRVINSFKYILR